MKQISVSWLTGILSLLQICLIDAATVGFPVLSRPHQMNPGEGSYVLFDAKFMTGVVTSFSAHFRKPAQSFSFQIWRPVNVFQDTPLFSLVAQETPPPTAISFTEVVLSNPIHVTDGDRLGFVYSGDEELPVSVTYYNRTINLYRQTSSLNPNIDEIVEFQVIQMPLKLSISATFDPDDETLPIRIIPGLVGPTGPPGPPGAPGPRGPKGSLGPKGARGPPGPKGDRGLDGVKGEPGPAGDVGASGSKGETGPAGETGATGRTGVKGDKGIVGSPGRPGPVGATGEPGITGAIGRPGVIGFRGRRGPPGQIGATGATGGTGATGSLGETGATGILGEPGETGPIGLPGLPGSPGPKGERGPAFQDVDECVSDLHGCQHKCVNTFGSYQCQCDEGYQLENDGRSCKDVDECITNNGGCQVLCTNTIGSYTCSCSSGTRLGPNGLHCADLDECQNNDGGCRQDELCVNTYGSYYCVLDAPIVYITKSGSKGGSNVKVNEMPLSPSSAELTLSAIKDEATNNLLNREVMIGIIVWLILLSLIILFVLLCLCVRKMKENKNFTKQQEYRQKRRENAGYSKEFRFY